MAQLYTVFIVCSIVIQTVNCAINAQIGDDCFVTKGCLRKPDNCIPFETCTYFMSYTVDPASSDSVTIELLRQVDRNNGKLQYVAMGLSKDSLMGDDAVTYCVFSGENQKPNIGLSYNPGKNSQLISNNTTGTILTPIESGVINSIFVCRFRQKIDPGNADPTRIWPLNNRYTVLLAGADFQESGLSSHTHGSADPMHPYISAAQVAMTDRDSYALKQASKQDCVGGLTKDNLEKAHGILMIFGWWVFVATAILFARYFRTSWPSKKIMGTLIWFNAHRFLNILGVLMIASGFICIFIAKCGRWVGDEIPKHAITGMTAAVCAFIQPIVAALRCHPGTAKRPIFNWIHRTIGLGGFCCACATIYFATFMDDMGLHYDAYGYAPRGMMIFYWAALVVVVVALELLITISERVKRRKITNEMQMQGLKGEVSTEGTGFISAPLWNTMRMVLLGIFVLIAIAVAITLSCFIGLT